MKSIIVPFRLSKQNYLPLDIADIHYFADELKKSEMGICDWDSGAGEEWISIKQNDGKWIGMIGIKIPISFVLCEAIESFYSLVTSRKCYVVSIDDFYAKEWCIDIELYNSEFPELPWVQDDYDDPNNVNPDSFSLNEFWWMTI